MNGKMILVLALGLMMSFSEGCSLQQMMGQMQQQAALGQIPQAPGATSLTGVDPLTGAVSAGLPQGATATGATDPGLALTQPSFTPAAPANTGSTPLVTDPNAQSPAVAAAGTTPIASAIGTGPINPATLPQIPAADPAGTATLVQNPVAPLN